MTEKSKYIYTRSFSVAEMACKCSICKDYDIAKMNVPFMLKLQKVRDWLAEPMIVSSGYRCRAHNEAVGGVSSSYHTRGRAVDIKCSDSQIRLDLVIYGFRAGMYGIGVSREFVHFDDRPFSERRTWTY